MVTQYTHIHIYIHVYTELKQVFSETLKFTENIYLKKCLKGRTQSNFAGPKSLNCVMTCYLKNTDLACKQGEE